jgi:hypothetical protein
MFSSDSLSGLNCRFRSKGSARLRRRRADRRLQVAAEVLRLEERCLMSTDILVPVPAGSDTALKNIFWNGGSDPTSGSGPASYITTVTATPTVRTITITNTSGHTIYPILEDSNSGQDPHNKKANNPGQWYDPQDYQDQEYRAYIGYQAAGGQQYLGLPTKSTIEIQVPLVFWNAENTYIGVDGQNLIPVALQGTAVVTGGAVTSFNITNGGSGYTSSQAVDFPAPPAGQGNTIAIGTAIVTNGSVTSVVVVNPGGGYTGNLTNVTTSASPPNPFTYDASSARGVAVQDGINSSWIINSGTKITGGVGLVMFYHATKSATIKADAPAQLTEFTIRDPYLGNWDDTTDATGILFNYDVSYVNDLLAPVAMEASSVPVPNQDSLTPQNYGWAGANLVYGPPTSTGSMSNLVQAFINSSAAANLGQYFGGQGWPDYYNPDGVLKIPSGANLFANSPLNGARSSYTQFGQINQWMLSSGGDAPIQVGANTNITDSTQTTFPLTFTGGVPASDPRSGPSFFANLALMLGPKTNGKYQNEVDFYIAGAQGFGPKLGTVTDYDATAGTITVSLDVSSLPTGGASLVFIKPATDYAATDITNLWYSWAQYYVDQYAGDKAYPDVQGTINAGTPNVVKLTGGIPMDLAVGWSATLTSGTGVVAAKGTTVTVLGINTKTDQVYLSQNATGAADGKYKFSPPSMLPFATGGKTGVDQITLGGVYGGYTQGAPQVKIEGGGGSGATAIAVVNKAGVITGIAITHEGTGYSASNPPTVSFSYGSAQATVTGIGRAPVSTFPITTQGQNPLNPILKFAGSVYEAMAAENAIVTYTGLNKLPPSMSLVYTTVGCDVQDLPNSVGPNAKLSTGVGSLVTTLIKSVLRGVYNYTLVPEFTGSKQNWYPVPSTETGGQKFNVYNLDPYVWFVHDVLKLSGYGFSVDDDTSDVGAPGLPGAVAGSVPTNLQMVFGSIAGVTDKNFNKNAWYTSLQWGTVTVTDVTLTPTTFDSKPATLATFALNPANKKKFWQISNPSPTTPGAFVAGGNSLSKVAIGTMVLAYGDVNKLELILTNTKLDITDATLTFTGKRGGG